MTTTYDPRHAAYFDEADVRNELSRVFDICNGCRLCTNFCGSFPSLFDMIGRSADHRQPPGAGGLTPAQQDLVVDGCFQCKRCVASCPYSHESVEQHIDFPRLVLRAQAMRHSNGQQRLQRGTATRVMAHTDLVGRIVTMFPSLSNRLVSARPGSLTRMLVARATGLSATRALPRFARQRFSVWFANRDNRFGFPGGSTGQESVVVYPTCIVEYQATSVGQDLVDVFEQIGIACAVSKVGCCGAPWLHAGNVKRFSKLAAHNVGKLADEVRSGRDIVVLQPMCAYVLKLDYPVYVGGADAALVAAHTFEASQYLVNVHHGIDNQVDPTAAGSVAAEVTYRPSSHLVALNIGAPGRDLMALSGSKVLLAADVPGDLGWWGMRAGNEQASSAVTTKLIDALVRSRNVANTDVANTDVAHTGAAAMTTGECLLTNASLAGQSGNEVLHPIEIVVSAYRSARRLDEL
jgi:glycerol-3-phosphate dehydrogenase subunit C